MATFVLVHGSWAGGWLWDRVRPKLEDAGHRVLTPTLTGLAERHHLSEPHIGLSVHVEDVARLMEWSCVHDAILVGRSYGGMVITGVAARVPDRIHHVVYVDAFAPITGESAFSQLPWLREVFAKSRGEQPWEVAPLNPGTLGADADDLAWLSSKLTSMPLLSHEEPLGLGSEEALASLPVTYLHCADQPLFDQVAESARNRGFRVVTITGSSHVQVLTQPGVLLEQLLPLAPGRAPGASTPAGGER
jgi:pimeloyl-ACP methyl ester carboxylesterase